ncbi:metallophosphoesterase [Maritimibacter sp. UBA3975]|uniref:metallophosphoesterase n=1 Tax=Maritimibacter sp. UBA3975 TaxID=1946833 RepID=UPI000C0B8725|nr:metallophosphoesterase [Maritimibacter sp. UBA3975]MAM63607.1 serine/threonine protein phosphatase [Maritimibacter sp.]|tara:strand:- start:12848 stop:13588 length:741 start_codon:yes stop_codon:yes gene_type:complete
MRTYSIGDIHGQRAELERVHTLIEADRKRTGDAEAPVVHIGDLCDRGPDTRGVIEFLMAGQARGENWVVLKGNHDRLMHWFLEPFPRHDPYLLVGYTWLHERIGGHESLESYGVTYSDRDRVFRVHADARSAVPQAHIDYLSSLPLTYERGDCFFCHAGIRPGLPLRDQTETDLLWIREEFHDSTADHGKLIVHGHTPVDHATHYGNRINLDTGAGYGRPIQPVVIEGRDAWLLTEDGRVPLPRGA